MALLDAVTPGGGRRQLIVMAGDVPSPAAPPSGCSFHPRCPRYLALGSPSLCRSERPALVALGRAQTWEHQAEHQVACHFPSV